MLKAIEFDDDDLDILKEALYVYRTDTDKRMDFYKDGARQKQDLQKLIRKIDALDTYIKSCI